MSEPWRTENWWVSPLNFDSNVIGKDRPNPPILHDVTLRDGEESANVVFSVDGKVNIAVALDSAGLPRIEFLLTTPGAEEAMERILDLGLNAQIYGAGGLVNPKNMAIALRCKVKNITLGIRTSDLAIKTSGGKSREKILEQCLDAIKTSKDHDMSVNLFLADCPRADLSFLEEVVRRCVETGADSVTVVDSVGTAIPQTIAYLVRMVKSWTDKPVEIHTHNDYGLGMATSLAGWEAGADVIHVTVNSLGYRCGNPATEEVALALEALYGVDTGVKLNHLYGLSVLVQEATNQPVAFNKPLSGPGAFGYEKYAPIKKALELKLPQAFYPYIPETIGRQQVLFLSKWSDVDMVKKKLDDLGKSIDDDQAEIFLKAVKEEAYRLKRSLNEEDIEILFRKTISQ